MVRYECCNTVEIEYIYKAFQIGFSDYIIKIEMDQELFQKHFFGAEGNQLENSFIAFDQEEPIGLVLGGVKMYEGIKTLRCGAFCIHPNYRGKGINYKLFDLHRQAGVKSQCKQLFLEVIVGNDRAIHFYKKLGYEKIYDLNYYQFDLELNHMEDVKDVKIDAKFNQHKTEYKTEITDNIGNDTTSVTIQRISFATVNTISQNLYDIHINWQNDMDYMAKLEGLIHYGVYEGNELLGVFSLNMRGKIYLLWIHPLKRGKGLGKQLIHQALKELNITKLNLCFPNNSNLTSFVKRLNFKKNDLSQYEMYQNL